MMKQYAHIMYVVPDLVAGQRFALGAWLIAPGRTTFVEATQQPGALCLGGASHERLAQRLLERVDSIKDVSDRGIALGLGQYARLSPALEIPADVDSPERWLREHVLPRHAPSTRSRPVRRRDAEGMRFFRTRNVDQLVKHRFDAQAYWKQQASLPWGSQARATHWVDGGERLLLLEPVVVRDDRTELNQIVARLMALQLAVDHLGVADSHRVAAYVVQGGPAGKRAHVLGALREGACGVWDTAQPREADALVDAVRQVAALHPSFVLA